MSATGVLSVRILSGYGSPRRQRQRGVRNTVVIDARTHHHNNHAGKSQSDPLNIA